MGNVHVGVSVETLHDRNISARAYRERDRGVPQAVWNPPFNAYLGARLVWRWASRGPEMPK